MSFLSESVKRYRWITFYCFLRAIDFFLTAAFFVGAFFRGFDDPEFGLAAVAAALACNSNYLTQRFTQIVGQRMHSYIVALRVDRAGRELLSTDVPIKQIAAESGFRDSAGLSRVFHRHVGVSPSEYRQIFNAK